MCVGLSSMDDDDDDHIVSSLVSLAKEEGREKNGFLCVFSSS